MYKRQVLGCFGFFFVQLFGGLVVDKVDQLLFILLFIDGDDGVSVDGVIPPSVRERHPGLVGAGGAVAGLGHKAAQFAFGHIRLNIRGGVAGHFIQGKGVGGLDVYKRQPLLWPPTAIWDG